MWRKARRWKRQICILIKRVVGQVRDDCHRVLTVLDVDVVMMEPAMLTEETGVEDTGRCLVENQMASDLSGLSASQLTQNQWWS